MRSTIKSIMLVSMTRCVISLRKLKELRMRPDTRLEKPMKGLVLPSSKSTKLSRRLLN